MSFAYKFCRTATPEVPQTSNTILLDKASSKAELTRQEKDRIAEMLYGLFGSQSSIYKLAGWAWPMYRCLKRVLVSFNHDQGMFHTYYAPDKTSLRKALSTPVSEMIYAPTKDYE